MSLFLAQSAPVRFCEMVLPANTSSCCGPLVAVCRGGRALVLALMLAAIFEIVLAVKALRLAQKLALVLALSRTLGDPQWDMGTVGA